MLIHAENVKATKGCWWCEVKIQYIDRDSIMNILN
jgi:hypothetical protein